MTVKALQIPYVSAKAAVAAPSGNFCNTCHQSWNCPPTGKEIKEGIIEGKMYCLDPRVLFKLNGEAFPRLVDVARGEKTLCGPKGRYWIPIKEIRVESEPTTSTYHRTRPQSKEQDRRQGHGQGHATQQTRSGPARKPYKVT